MAHSNEKTSLHHDIKIEEMAVRDYYWPLLIGTLAGFVVLVIFVTAAVCLCCRRKYRKKLSIVKEEKNPKLFDGIYTIGLPPPIYEATGIPPLSYEEIRGEKMTGKAPETESESRVGQVTDI